MVKYPQGNPFKNCVDGKKSFKNTLEKKETTIQSLPTSCSSASPSSSASVHSSPNSTSSSSSSNTTNEITLHKSDENINEKVGVDLGNLNTESTTDSSPAASSSSKSSSSSANQDEPVVEEDEKIKTTNYTKIEPTRISRQERDNVMKAVKKLNSKELVRQLSLSRLNEDIKLEIPRTFTLKKRMHKELLEKMAFIDKDSSFESSIESSQDTISFHESSPLSKSAEKQNEIKRKISKIHVKLNENVQNNKQHTMNEDNDEEDYVIEYVTLNEYSEIPNLNGLTSKKKTITKTMAIINVNEVNDTSLSSLNDQLQNKNLTAESLPFNESIQLVNQNEDDENDRNSLKSFINEKQSRPAEDETINDKEEDDEMLLDKEVIENMTQFRIDENMINMMNQHNQNGCETSSDEDLKSISSIEGSLKGISSKLALAYDHDENCKIDDPKIINTTTNNKFNHSSSTPLIYLYPNLGNHNNHNNNSHSHNNHNSYINLYLKLK